jgi:hypothetical protein
MATRPPSSGSDASFWGFALSLLPEEERTKVLTVALPRIPSFSEFPDAEIVGFLTDRSFSVTPESRLAQTPFTPSPVKNMTPPGPAQTPLDPAQTPLGSEKAFFTPLDPSETTGKGAIASASVNIELAEALKEKTWDELTATDLGSGFVRTMKIKIGGQKHKVWVKRPRHLGRVLLASLVSRHLDDESVVPAAITRLADGTLVTVQPNDKTFIHTFDTLLHDLATQKINISTLASFINAISLSLFDDSALNREGQFCKTADLESSFPISSNPTISETSPYTGKRVIRPKIFSVLPLLLLKQGNLHAPIPDEMKDEVLTMIGPPAAFIETILAEYLSFCSALHITESRYEDISSECLIPEEHIVRAVEVEIKTEGKPRTEIRHVKAMNVQPEAELMLTGLQECLTAICDALTKEGATPFDLLEASNPLFAKMFHVACDIYRAATLIDNMEGLFGPGTSINETVDKMAEELGKKHPHISSLENFFWDMRLGRGMHKKTVNELLAKFEEGDPRIIEIKAMVPEADRDLTLSALTKKAGEQDPRIAEIKVMTDGVDPSTTPCADMFTEKTLLPHDAIWS